VDVAVEVDTHIVRSWPGR